jgi:outer membrane protein TolC
MRRAVVIEDNLKTVSCGNTNGWSIGANVSGPIFAGGAIKAQNRQAVAAWQEARAEYEETAFEYL